MGVETCKCGGCRAVRAKTDAPLVGAQVEVTLAGEVRSVLRSGALLLRVGNGFEASDHWLPANVTAKVVSPPRPREVLLLECGHVQHQLSPVAEVGETVYCCRDGCHMSRRVDKVGSVTW